MTRLNGHRNNLTTKKQLFRYIFHKSKSATNYIIILLIISQLFFNCSKTNQNTEGSQSGKITPEAEQYTQISQKFLGNYIAGFQNKDTAAITQMYSTDAAESLDRPAALTELFNAVDTIAITYKEINIKETSTENKIIFDVILNSSISLGAKKLADNKQVEFVLIKENEKYKLRDKRTLKIL